MTPEKQLGNLLKEYRQQANLSQSELADQINNLNIVEFHISHLKIGELLKAARNNRKLSQENLADKINLKSDGRFFFTQPKISNAERFGKITAVELLVYLAVLEAAFEPFKEVVIIDETIELSEKNYEFNQPKISNAERNGKISAVDFLVYLKALNAAIEPFQSIVSMG